MTRKDEYLRSLQERLTWSSSDLVRLTPEQAAEATLDLESLTAAPPAFRRFPGRRGFRPIRIGGRFGRLRPPSVPPTPPRITGLSGGDLFDPHLHPRGPGGRFRQTPDAPLPLRVTGIEVRGPTLDSPIPIIPDPNPPIFDRNPTNEAAEFRRTAYSAFPRDPTLNNQIAREAIELERRLHSTDPRDVAWSNDFWSSREVGRRDVQDSIRDAEMAESRRGIDRPLDPDVPANETRRAGSDDPLFNEEDAYGDAMYTHYHEEYIGPLGVITSADQAAAEDYAARLSQESITEFRRRQRSTDYEDRAWMGLYREALTDGSASNPRVAYELANQGERLNRLNEINHMSAQADRLWSSNHPITHPYRTRGETLEDFRTQMTGDLRYHFNSDAPISREFTRAYMNQRALRHEARPGLTADRGTPLDAWDAGMMARGRAEDAEIAARRAVAARVAREGPTPATIDQVINEYRNDAGPRLLRTAQENPAYHRPASQARMWEDEFASDYRHALFTDPAAYQDYLRYQAEGRSPSETQGLVVRNTRARQLAREAAEAGPTPEDLDQFEIDYQAEVIPGFTDIARQSGDYPDPANQAEIWADGLSRTLRQPFADDPQRWIDYQAARARGANVRASYEEATALAEARRATEDTFLAVPDDDLEIEDVTEPGQSQREAFESSMADHVLDMDAEQMIQDRFNETYHMHTTYDLRWTRHYDEAIADGRSPWGAALRADDRTVESFPGESYRVIPTEYREVPLRPESPEAASMLGDLTPDQRLQGNTTPDAWEALPDRTAAVDEDVRAWQAHRTDHASRSGIRDADASGREDADRLRELLTTNQPGNIAFRNAWFTARAQGLDLDQSWFNAAQARNMSRNEHLRRQSPPPPSAPTPTRRPTTPEDLDTPVEFVDEVEEARNARLRAAEAANVSRTGPRYERLDNEPPYRRAYNDARQQGLSQEEAFAQADEVYPPLPVRQRRLADALYKTSFTDRQGRPYTTDFSYLHYDNSFTVEGVIYDENGNRVGDFKRVVYYQDGSPHHVTHASMNVADSHQANGISDALAEHWESSYREAGVKYITLTAAGGRSSNGSYTWARRGYTWEDDSVNLPRHLSDSLEEALDNPLTPFATRDEIRYLLAQAQLRRVEPKEIAYIGRTVEQHEIVLDDGRRLPSWWGKDFLLRHNWEGKKRLNPD